MQPSTHGTRGTLTSGLQSFGDLTQGETHLQQGHSDGRRRGGRRQPAAGIRQSYGKHQAVVSEISMTSGMWV